MRCQHVGVCEHAKNIRSWRNGDEQDPRCRRSGLYEVRGKWYCLQHRDVWLVHWRIVDRIRRYAIH